MDEIDSKLRAENSQSATDTWKSWALCLSASFTTAICYGFYLGCTSLYFVALLHEFGESRGNTAIVGSISSAMGFLPGPVAAALTKRYGSRCTVLVGSLMCVTGLFISSFAQNIAWVVLFFSIIGATGSGLIFITSFAVVTKAFDKYQSFALGILAAGAVTGFILFPPMINYLIREYGIWKTFRIMGGICVSCCLTAIAYPCNVERVDKTFKEERTFPQRLKKDLDLLSIPAFSLLTVIHMLAYLGYYIPFQHMLRFSEEQGLTTETTSWFLTYYGISTFVGRIFFGKLIDLCRRIDMIALYVSQCSAFGIAVATLIVSHSSSYTGVLVFFIVYGLCDGGFSAQQTVIVLKCVGEKNLDMAWGVFTFLYAVFIALGAPIGGWIADYFDSYLPCFYFAASVLLTAAFLFTFVPWCRRGDRRDIEEVELAPECIVIVERETCL